MGLKRKSDAKSGNDATPSKRKFLDLNLNNQSLTIVGWLTNKTANQILNKKTAIHEIIQDTERFNRLRNDSINVSGTKKYFEPKTYKYLCSEIEKLEGKDWHCVHCKKKLCGDQIMCHSCLDWYHVKCVEYPKSKGNIDFFCKDCKQNSQLIIL